MNHRKEEEKMILESNSCYFSVTYCDLSSVILFVGFWSAVKLLQILKKSFMGNLADLGDCKEWLL